MDAKAVAIGSLKSKTQWVAALVVLLGVIVDNPQAIGNLIPQEYVGKLMSGIGLLFMWLRMVTATSLSEKGAPAGAAAKDPQRGFITVRFLVLLAGLSVGVVLGGCGAMPKAPATFLEQVEALEIAGQQVGESIVNLTCTKYMNGRCIEPGKSFDAAQGNDYHKKVQDARAALRASVAIGDGQVGMCLGQNRTQAACFAAARMLLLQMEQKVLTAQAQGGKP